MAGGPACPAEGDKCAAACEWFADCGISECAGYDDTARESLVAGCLETCANSAALAAIVCGHTECGQTVALGQNSSPDFAAGCEGGAGGMGGMGGAGGGPGEATCADVCDRIQNECMQGDPGDPGDVAACIEGCTDANPSAEVLACALAAPCEQIEQCAEPIDPEIEAECRALCPNLVTCGEVPPGSEEVAIEECVTGCAIESTAEERACVSAAGASCDAVFACFGQEPPPPVDPEVEAQCTQICDGFLDCFAGAMVPDDQRELARAECTAGCIEASTAEERTCLLALEPGNCEAANTCFEAEPPPPPPQP